MTPVWYWPTALLFLRTLVASPDTGFVVTGDPTSRHGATWTFRGTVDGVSYDLAGALYRPEGAGPFAAVIASHGFEGNGPFFARIVCPTFVSWGLVCIAPNYTHASGVPIGAPGNSTAPGASRANVLRLRMTVLLLRRLGYVDSSRIALHGHSMGAYLSVAAAAAIPNAFRAASTTGGGIRPDGLRTAAPAPTSQVARSVRTPFQMHHGASDNTVPLSFDERLSEVLAAEHVPHELFTYPGRGHLEVRSDSLVMGRIRAWYAAHGMF